MKTVCIIQARRGSQRLRDKILMPLSGKAVLEHVIDRAALIEGVDEVVCATVDDAFNRPVMALAEKAGASVFAGSEHDVLSRYYHAAVQYKASAVMRITADCPLLDPYVCARSVSGIRTGNLDYCATAGEWPHGMDCEVFTFEWLEKAHQFATLEEDREHVTLWMKGHSSMRRKTIDPTVSGLRDNNRWVIDYPEDYEFLTKLADLAPGGALPLKWQDTLALLDANPHLREINRHCAEEWEKENAAVYKLAREERS